MTDKHIWKEKQKQKPTLFLTKQCWFPRYKVPLLSTCGRCHPEGFIVASLYNFKHIANNNDNNKNDDANNDNDIMFISRVMVIKMSNNGSYFVFFGDDNKTLVTI